MKTIETFMDFICPFSYIGFSILNRVRKEEKDVNYIWYPFILNESTPKEGSEIGDTFDEKKRKKVLKRLESLGSEYDLAFDSGPLIFNSTRAHKAALYARDNGKFYEFAKEVFDAVFKNATNIAKEDVLNKIASSLDLDVNEMNESIDGGKYDSYIEEAKKFAKKYQVNSVPTFIVDEKKKVTDLTNYEDFKTNLFN